MSTPPRLILAHGNPDYAGRVGREFERLGWEVHPVRSGSEARRLARTLKPQLVVLAAEARQETGWLTCAKLRQEQPGCRVILVGHEPTPECARLTEFVGAAALVEQGAGVDALVEEVCGAAQVQ
jgi:DNA-binding response OmpR family regulator